MGKNNSNIKINLLKILVALILIGVMVFAGLPSKVEAGSQIIGITGEAPQSNTLATIFIVLGVILVIMTVVLIIMRKKSEQDKK